MRFKTSVSNVFTILLSLFILSCQESFQFNKSESLLVEKSDSKKSNSQNKNSCQEAPSISTEQNFFQGELGDSFPVTITITNNNASSCDQETFQFFKKFPQEITTDLENIITLSPGEQRVINFNFFTDSSSIDQKYAARLAIYPQGNFPLYSSIEFTFDLSEQAPQVLKAFPSAVGGGSRATGGRGGQVIHVTNLNNSGPGSLRAALTTTGPRIVVFDVSGRIHLTSHIEMNGPHSNLTIAGQTAPEGGITISGRPLLFGGQWNLSISPTNNVIIRHIRFRNGSYTGEPDQFMHNGIITAGGEDIILDNCSFSFNDDQAISFGTTHGALKRITVQRSIFSENATGIIAGNAGGNHGTEELSFLYNLFVDQGHRTPNMGASGNNARYDVINNIIFNWKSRLSTTNAYHGHIKLNYMNNYLKPGSYSHATVANKVQNGSSSNFSIYTGGNYHPFHYPSPQENDRNLWTYFSNTNYASSNYFVAAAHPLLENTPEPLTAEMAYNDVLANVGANKYIDDQGHARFYQDSYDTQKISNVINSISSDPQNKSWVQPVLPTNTRPSNYDTDNDGMSDAWELRVFGDLSRSSSADEDGDGYTNIEEFINQ